MNYSIIIPHKNCPELLARCIASIPTRDDIEVVVIDDNSEDIDSVKEVIASRALPNLRLVCRDEGRGAGFARNIGLEQASGEWLLFLDADDFFLEDAFEHLDAYLNSEYDIVYFKHISVRSDTYEHCERFPARNDRITAYLLDKTSENELSIRYLDTVPWAKMFRRSLVVNNHLRFDEVPAYNDVTFVSNAAYYAKTISTNEACVYCATYRTGSISYTPNKVNLFSSYEVYLRHWLFLDKIGCPQLKGRIVPKIVEAYRLFGYKEAKKYFNTAREYKVSLFPGILTIPFLLLKK